MAGQRGERACELFKVGTGDRALHPVSDPCNDVLFDAAQPFSSRPSFPHQMEGEGSMADWRRAVQLV